MTDLDTDCSLSYTRPSDEENLRETVAEKRALMSGIPGLVVEFDPEEAEQAGAFREYALSEKDALASVFDEHPYSETTEE